VAKGVGALILLSLLSPQLRELIFGIGFIVACLFAVAAVCLAGFCIYRRETRSQQTSPGPASEHAFDYRAIATSENPPRTRASVGTAPPPPQTTEKLLEKLRSIDWFQFEKLVALLYRKLGYTASRRGGANPDGGIDLVIEKDGRRAAVQCKHWKTWNVGVKPVREFLGALTDAKLTKGILITLRGYTGDARQLAAKHGIEIVNETGLAHMLEKTDARFDPEALEILNDARKFCPKCARGMVLRTASKGPGAGKQFWGCSAYPKCNYTLKLSLCAHAKFSPITTPPPPPAAQTPPESHHN
jgi:hypothetical protein